MKQAPKISSDLHEQIITWWNEPLSNNKKFSTLSLLKTSASRSGFGEGLYDLISLNKNILALTANLGSSTALSKIASDFPDNFFDMGVAEQSFAGIAAGLASEGKLVAITSFAVFSPGRNWDFIRAQIALNKLPVLVLGSHAGLATGADGATHQALEDLALMRSLPNMIICSPLDAGEAAAMTRTLFRMKNLPAYLRVAREKTPILFKEKKPFVLGKATVLCQGSDIVIHTSGITAFQALQATKILWVTYKVSATIIHHGTIKPIDEKIVVKSAEKKKLILSIEDHQVIGGLGSCIAEVLAENALGVPFKRLGVRDSFGESGSYEQLCKKHGFDAGSIVKLVLSSLKKKK